MLAHSDNPDSLHQHHPNRDQTQTVHSYAACLAAPGPVEPMQKRLHLVIYHLNPNRHQVSRRVDNSWFAHTNCFAVDGKGHCSTFL